MEQKSNRVHSASSDQHSRAFEYLSQAFSNFSQNLSNFTQILKILIFHKITASINVETEWGSYHQHPWVTRTLTNMAWTQVKSCFHYLGPGDSSVCVYPHGSSELSLATLGFLRCRDFIPVWEKQFFHSLSMSLKID